MTKEQLIIGGIGIGAGAVLGLGGRFAYDCLTKEKLYADNKVVGRVKKNMVERIVIVPEKGNWVVTQSPENKPE